MNHLIGQRPSRQRGASLVVILIIVFFVVLLATFGLKMGTSYTQHMTLGSVMKDLAAEPNAASRSMNQTWNLLETRLSVNSIYDRKRDDFEIVEDGEDKYLVVQYEVRKPFVANIDVVARFEHSELLHRPEGNRD